MDNIICKTGMALDYSNDRAIQLSANLLRSFILIATEYLTVIFIVTVHWRNK